MAGLVAGLGDQGLLARPSTRWRKLPIYGPTDMSVQTCIAFVCKFPKPLWTNQLLACRAFILVHENASKLNVKFARTEKVAEKHLHVPGDDCCRRDEGKLLGKHCSRLSSD